MNCMVPEVAIQDPLKPLAYDGRGFPPLLLELSLQLTSFADTSWPFGFHCSAGTMREAPNEVRVRCGIADPESAVFKRRRPRLFLSRNPHTTNDRECRSGAWIASQPLERYAALSDTISDERIAADLSEPATTAACTTMVAAATSWVRSPARNAARALSSRPRSCWSNVTSSDPFGNSNWPRFQEKLDQCGGGGRSSLLESRDGLADGGSTGFPVSLLELGKRHPAEECIGSDTSHFSGLLEVPLSEERGDRIFLFAAEFSAWRFHLPRVGKTTPFLPCT